MGKNKKIINVTLYVLFFLVGTLGVSGIETLLSYQGKLNNATTGDAFTTASLRINVTEINDLDLVLWNNTFDDALDQYGVFSLVLGSNKSLNLSPGRNYQLVVEVDLDSTTFGSANLIYGDLNPSGDSIRVTAGGASDATELYLSDNVTTLEQGLVDKITNDSDVRFGNVSISRNLTVMGDINLTGYINCDRIVGGSDSDFCGDTGGSGVGIGNGTDGFVARLYVTENATINRLNITNTANIAGNLTVGIQPAEDVVHIYTPGNTNLRLESPLTTDTETQIYFTKTGEGNNPKWAIGRSTWANFDGDTFALFENDTQEYARFVVLPGGYFGINTSTPTTTLDVAGRLNASRITIGNTDVCLSNGTNCLAGSTTGITNSTDVALTTLNISQSLNVSKEVFVTGNLTVGQNLTLAQYSSCALETDGNGKLLCGTDASAGSAVQNNTDVEFQNLKVNLNASIEILNTSNFTMQRNGFAEDVNLLIRNLAGYPAGIIISGGGDGAKIMSNGGDIGGTSSKLEVNLPGSLGVYNTRFIIQASGNVGIGTVNPTTTLDVNGTINATRIIINNVDVCLENGTNCLTGSPPGITNATDARLSTLNITQSLNVSKEVFVTGNLSLGQNLTLSQYSSCSALETDGNGKLQCGEDNIGSGTVQNGTDTQFNDLNLTGNLNVTGTLRVGERIGIGLTNPMDTLVIGEFPISNGRGPNITILNLDPELGTYQILGALNFGSNDTSTRMNIGAYIDAIATGDWDGTGGVSANDNPTALRFYTQDNTGFSSFNAPRMYISETGYIGVNTTSPQSELDVRGRINASRITIDDVNVCLENGTNCLAGSPSGIANDTDVQFNNVNITGNLNVTRNASFGNSVGIGTIHPTHELDVTGTINTTQLRVHENVSLDRLNVTSGIQAHDTLIMPKQTTYWEYQETANSSYNFDSVSGGTWADTSNFGDGVWDSTYAYKSDNDFWPGRVEVHYNYSKPARAIGAKVMLKADDTDIPTTLNKTVSSSCFSAYSDVIALHVMIFRASDAYDYSRLYCWNSTAWSSLGTWDEGGADATLDIEIYEEAVHWQMESIPQIGIGVIEPQYNLEVNGSVALKDTLYIPDAGKVGIGTRNPTSKLHVIGEANFTTGGSTLAHIDEFSAGAGTLRLTYLGSETIRLNSDGLSFLNSGNVGISATDPSQTLTVGGGVNISGALNVSGVASVSSITTGGGDTVAYNRFGTGTPEHTANITDGNDVYISDDLEVDGNAWLGAGSTSSGVYWTGSDIAEVMHTTYSRNDTECSGDINCLEQAEDLGYGDLVCIDPENVVLIQKCTQAYSPLVFGFVSETTVLHMGIDNGYPIAVAGLVQAKVSNINGAIHPGDLLVSSDIPGTAMKAQDPDLGTVVGKAYANCDEEFCKIPVVVALA